MHRGDLLISNIGMIRSHSVKQLIIILALSCLTACGGKDVVSREDQQAAAFADLRAAVEEVVASEEGQNAALDLVANIEDKIDELRVMLVYRRAELRRKYTRGDLNEIVADEGRRSEADDTLKAMASLTKERNKTAKRHLERLRDDLAMHDANQDDLDAIFDEYLVSLNAYNEDMIDFRFQLKDQLTREEWENLFANDGGGES